KDGLPAHAASPGTVYAVRRSFDRGITAESGTHRTPKRSIKTRHAPAREPLWRGWRGTLHWSMEWEIIRMLGARGVSDLVNLQIHDASNALHGGVPEVRTRLADAGLLDRICPGSPRRKSDSAAADR